MKKELFSLIKITTLALVFSVGVSYLFAWTGNNSPPLNNKAEPINISNTPQSKGGIGIPGYLFNINGYFSADNILTSGLATFDGDFQIRGLTKGSTNTLCADEDGKIIYCAPPSTFTSPNVAVGTTGNITSGGVIVSNNLISSDGGSTVFRRGVVWGLSNNPEIGVNNFTQDGAGTGSYLSSITGLSPNTTYYVRAYATNSVGTSYSSVSRTFKTSLPLYLLQVSRSGEASFNGTIASNVGGISCSASLANCQAFYSADSTVVLSATTINNSFLTGWIGCDSTTGSLPNQTCSVLMSNYKTVTANFISCNGQYIAGYCWYKANLNQNCNSYCSNNGHGSCVQSSLNRAIDTQICSSLSMGTIQMSSGSLVSPRTDNSSCYVNSNSTTPATYYSPSTCSSVYSQYQANACSCSR